MASADILVYVILVQQFELPDLRFLLRVSPNHTHTREIFLDAAADVGKHLLDGFEAIVNAASEQDHRHADHRRGNEAEQRQPPIHPGHDGNQKESGEECLGEVHDAGAEHHANRVQIVGGARHDVAGAVFRVEVLRERDNVREQIVTEIELDVARQADEDHAHPVLEDSSYH